MYICIYRSLYTEEKSKEPFESLKKYMDIYYLPFLNLYFALFANPRACGVQDARAPFITAEWWSMSPAAVVQCAVVTRTGKAGHRLHSRARPHPAPKT